MYSKSKLQNSPQVDDAISSQNEKKMNNDIVSDTGDYNAASDLGQEYSKNNLRGTKKVVYQETPDYTEQSMFNQHTDRTRGLNDFK